MKEVTYRFSEREVTYYFEAQFSYLENLVEKDKAILLVDENIAQCHSAKLAGWQTIVIPPGEVNKQQSTADKIILELIQKGADRQSFLIGVGGGVITDMAGYVASVYMRGIKFAFVPTTLLAMVDASVGGKNGVDVGMYKNLVGTINQPQFILFDYSLLQTLPEAEWVNGCAEMIKHGCIKDPDLFALLEKNTLTSLRSNLSLLGSIVERNVLLKSEVVQKDEFEKGERRLLNFGHTLAHAIENKYQLSHGQAVSIGMVAAATLSTAINGFKETDNTRLLNVLQQYHLPVHFEYDKQQTFATLLMDKKREGTTMHYVLLSAIGQAVVKSIPLNQLKDLLFK